MKLGGRLDVQFPLDQSFDVVQGHGRLFARAECIDGLNVAVLVKLGERLLAGFGCCAMLPSINAPRQSGKESRPLPALDWDIASMHDGYLPR